jgi:hypothetical protein
VIFSLFVYPHIVSAVGGGRPIPATLSLTSSGSPKVRDVSVNIIDETEAGYYVVESGTRFVRFVPRALVVSIEFDAPEFSPLLRGILNVSHQ